MRKSGRDKRNYLIIGLCAVVVAMAVGFAAFSSQLNINGTSEVTGSWCVGFDTSKTTDYVATPGITGAAEPSASIAFDGISCGNANYKTGANLSASFKQPGDMVNYTLTIKNDSSVDAKIDSIVVGDKKINIEKTYTEGNIKFIIGMPLDTSLSSGESTTMNVKIQFQNDIDLTQNTINEVQNLSIKINASQDDGSGGMATVPVNECTFNGELIQGAEYVNGQYTYRYMQESAGSSWNNINDDGWGVSLTDKSSTSPVTSNLCTSINGKPIVSMNAMFSGAKATSIDTRSFDTSNVKNMNAMFSGCNSLTSLDLSTFDTSNVTTMDVMFNGCSGLTTLDVSNFETSNVTAMGAMFNGCSNLTTIDVSNFDISKVTNMGSMFGGCSSLKKANVDNFIINNIYAIGGIFSSDNALEEISARNWKIPQVFNVGFFNYMQISGNIKVIDVSNWDLSKTTNISNLFHSSSTIREIKGLNTWDTSNITDMSGLFTNDSALESLDLSSFNTSNVTNTSGMFYGLTLTQAYARTQADIDKFNASSGKPSTLTFVLK
ncbi:MAG: BspA family leucine-rich repeat surface protein [Bacilli bacterium]|nr:BspA family leucine-rich repeat surface protein [Bacilli bacterium]